MDLTFQKTPISYLRTTVSQAGIREETTEVVLPDRDPDIGRVISAWAIPVVRSRELQSGNMTVSGGINAWVLYSPADGGNPRAVNAYIPFSMGWDIPGNEQGEGMCVSCRMHGVDARMIGARKLLIRATVACHGEAYCQTEADFYSLPEPPTDVEVLRQHLPLSLPSEICDKQFRLEEILEMPAGAPPVSQIVAWQLEPAMTDSKVMGDKVVFKGNLRLHLIYMTPEDRLAVWDFEIPFSQYAELTRHYDREEETQCRNLITEADLTINEETQELSLNCGLCIQCMVLQEQLVEVVADLYSPHRAVTTQISSVPIRARLDHQRLHQQADISFPIHGCTIIDATALPSLPRVNRSGDTAIVETPVWCNILYYDDAGTLQGRQIRVNTTKELNLASGCPCNAGSNISGSIQWNGDGGGVAVRVPIELTVDSYSQQELSMLSGAALGEKSCPDPNRPSLIIRSPKPEDTLWSLAKEHGSTVDAICKANHMKLGPIKDNTMLLIPVV